MEKQAVTTVQQVPAVRLDTTLPGAAFAGWFKRQVGAQAGIIWQLSECGELAGASTYLGRDLIDRDLKACVEVNAMLPDDRKVIVMVTVGTFKRGMTGDPQFYYAVIEERGELRPILQLRDLQRLVQRLPPRPSQPLSHRLHPAGGSPALPTRPARQPGIPTVPLAESAHRLIFINNQASRRLLEIGAGYRPGGMVLGTPPPSPPPPPLLKSSSRPESPRPESSKPEPRPSPLPSPPKPDQQPGPTGDVLQGSARIKVQPRYPANARRVSASGPVEVRIVISETGHVTEAGAISGHPLLRSASVEAARKWVFNPTTINGIPVKTQMTLNFVFTAP